MGSDCLTVPYSLRILPLKVALEACQLSGTQAGLPFCVAIALAMLSTPQSRGPGMAFPDLASGFYKELFISTEFFQSLSCRPEVGPAVSTQPGCSGNSLAL